MDFELRHLRYFVAVAEELHFGRAARRLGVSQPPLSRQVRDLEDAVGVQLLVRTRRSVELTPAGATFLAEASTILRRTRDAVTRARAIASGARGALSIAFSETAAASGALQRTLARYRATHGDIELQLEELTAAEQATAFERDELDVAFGYRLPPLESSLVHATKLFEEPLLIALSETDPLATARRLDPAALGERALLFLPRRAAPELHGRVLRELARVGVVPRHVREVRRLRAVFALVACGAGFGLAPRSTVASAPPGLVFRRLPRFEMRLATYVFTRASADLPHVRAFVQAAITTRGSSAPAG